jgi:predicted metal-dependent peptidase
MSREADKLRKARTQMVLDHPFFGFLSCYLEPKEQPETETLSTDGRHLLFNPEFVKKSSMDELRFVIAHVVQHLALDHCGRRNGRDEKVWDLASDFAANQMLVSYGIKPPPSLPVAYDPAYAKKSAEEIYDALYCDSKKCEGAPRLDTHQECQGDRKDWKERVVRVTTLLKQQGRLPGELEEEVRKLLEPRVNWRRILYRFILQAAKFDYSYARCNRRYVPQGVYIPGVQSEKIENLVIAIDTSGSITDAQVAQFLGEVNSITQQFQISWKLVTCDAQIQDTYDVDQAIDLGRVKIRGRGGTSFKPVFEWIESAGINPVGLVYLTDGMGDYPEQPPHYPVLWALIQPYETPFGENVVIES